MKPFLQSDRLYFREVQESDVNDTYYQWMNDPELNRYIDTRFYPQSREMIRDYYETHRDGKNEPWFAICLLENNLHIGNAKLGPINWIRRSSGLSYLLGDKNYHNKGYGTEACGMLLRYAFAILGLNRVETFIHSGNVASLKLCLKCGFRVEGCMRETNFNDGKWFDTHVLGVLSSEYFDLHPEAE